MIGLKIRTVQDRRNSSVVTLGHLHPTISLLLWKLGFHHHLYFLLVVLGKKISVSNPLGGVKSDKQFQLSDKPKEELIFLFLLNLEGK